ncbi:MAG TPA: response regulator [Desulfomonilaceae bacterium]|nr:response regulator [Desulfomonilaceae bacterium]
MIKKEPSNILIVDDEPQICQLLARYLTAEGYNCRVASGGEEALKSLESDKFQLVLADIIMQGMSGIDLLNVVRSLYPDVAVLMVTAVDDRDTGILAVELGAYGYIIKPFERNEILINVANALERRRLAILAKEKTGSHRSGTQPMTLRRRPIKIPTKEIVHLIKSGTDEASLMERFNLSAKALHSLMDQLVAAKVLTESEVDRRRSLSPGSVVIDLVQAKFPEMTKEKPVISGADAAKCIRSGMDDSSLMKRYGISAKGLRSLFGKLVASGIIQQSELDKRMSETHEWAVIDE